MRQKRGQRAADAAQAAAACRPGTVAGRCGDDAASDAATSTSAASPAVQQAPQAAAISRLWQLGQISVAAALPSVLEQLIAAGMAMSGADFANILLRDAAGGPLRIAAHYGYPDGWLQDWNDAACYDAPSAAAVASGTRQIVADVELSPLFAGSAELQLLRKASIRALQITPVASRSGVLAGLITLHYRHPHHPQPDELQLLDLLARQAADLIEPVHAHEQRLRALVSAAGSVAYQVSPNWDAVRFFEGSGVVSAYSHCSQSWLEIFALPQAHARLGQSLRDATGNKTVFELEHPSRRGDGSLAWVHTRVVPCFDSAGEIREWIGLTRDLSEHRSTQSARFALQQKLDALMRALPVGVAISTDTSCRPLSANPALAALLNPAGVEQLFSGAVPPTAPSQKIHFYQHGSLLPEHEFPLQRAIHEGKVILPTELEAVLPDGRRLHLEVGAAPIRDEYGKTLAGVAVFNDVSVRRQEAEYREHTRLRDEFLALLGHALRDPLAAISGAIEALANNTGHLRREELETLIARQVESLQHLSDELVGVSRITDRAAAPKQEAIDLAELLHAAVGSTRRTVTERGQEVLVQAPDGGTCIMGDRQRLYRIVSTLLGHVAKSSQRGSSIALSGAVENAGVLIRCEGEAGRVAPLPPQPAADSVHSAGPDVGLNLVRRLVTILGGEISSSGENAGNGCEITVRLPFLAPAATAPATAPAAAAAAAPAPAGALDFLFVGEHPELVAELAGALTHMGHRVRSYVSADSALAALVGRCPHLVLVDGALKGVDAHQLVANMRRLAYLKNTLFLAVSATPPKSSKQAADGAFDHYLDWPLQAAKLLELAQRGVGERKPARIRTLLVEDHPDLALATATLLRREGLEVDIARTAAQAIKAVADGAPDLLLCDLNLPDMNGLQLVRSLRATYPQHAMRVVIVSAYSDADLQIFRRSSKELNIDDFISKPITADSIRKMIATLASQPGQQSQATTDTQ
ncbi:MAG: response regulator [Rhodocyclaceae bacterium]|nr:response regulator [Rhodocyclaceae bacterium]